MSLLDLGPQRQIIYSRFEYPLEPNQTTFEVFDQYNNLFGREFDHRGVRIAGVGISIATLPTIGKRAIAMAMCNDSDLYLRLKFCGRKDVMFNDYRPSLKERGII